MDIQDAWYSLTTEERLVAHTIFTSWDGSREQLKEFIDMCGDAKSLIRILTCLDMVQSSEDAHVILGDFATQ